MRWGERGRIMTLYERLDALMETHEIKSKAELARLSGITYTTIDGIFKKGQENITLKTLRRISDYFGCTLDYLVNGIEDDPEDAAILELIEAAKGNDRDDIRRAADTLRKMKAYKEQYNRLAAYAAGLKR